MNLGKYRKKIENVITDDRTNNDTDEEEVELLERQDIEEEQKEQEIIHGEDDIIEDEISIENLYDNIDINVKEEPEEGVEKK